MLEADNVLDKLAVRKTSLLRQFGRYSGEYFLYGSWHTNSRNPHIMLGTLSPDSNISLRHSKSYNDWILLITPKEDKFTELNSPFRQETSDVAMPVLRHGPMKIASAWLLSCGLDGLSDPRRYHSKFAEHNRVLLIGDEEVYAWVLGQAMYMDVKRPFWLLGGKNGQSKEDEVLDAAKNPVLMAQFRMMQLPLSRDIVGSEGVKLVKDLRKEVLTELSKLVDSYFGSQESYFRRSIKEQMVYWTRRAVAFGMDITDELSTEKVVALGREFRADEFVNGAILYLGLQG